jgi:hypothetical protein
LVVPCPVICNFNSKLWAALDGTYCTGERTSLNGSLDDDLQRNSRWGVKFAYALARHNSIKLYSNSGWQHATERISASAESPGNTDWGRVLKSNRYVRDSQSVSRGTV